MSSAVSIWTVLSFFSTLKSICVAVSGAIALFVASKDAGGPRNSETVGILAKSCSSKELFVFSRNALFRFFPTLCLGTLFLKVAPPCQGFRSVASVSSSGLENIFSKK